MSSLIELQKLLTKLKISEDDLKIFKEQLTVTEKTELTNYKSVQDALRDIFKVDWDLARITYQGIPITKLIYEDLRVIGVLEKEVGIETFLEGLTKDGDPYSILVKGQECFLGFNLKDQTFYSGFDLVIGTTISSALVKYRINNAPDRITVLGVESAPDMFYKSLYTRCKDRHDIVDIRLDHLPGYEVSKYDEVNDSW